MNHINHSNRASSSAGSKGRKYSSTALLLLALFAAGCKNSDSNPPLKGENKPATSQPVAPTAAPEQHEYKNFALSQGGKKIGDVVYDFDYFKRIDAPGYTQQKAGQYTILSQDGDNYVTVIRHNVGDDKSDVTFPVTNLKGDSVKPVSANHLVRKEGNHYELIKISGTDKVVLSMEGEVKSYSTIEEGSVSDIQSIATLGNIPYKGLVLIMKDGSKHYLRENTSLPVNDISFEQLDTVKGHEKSLVVTTSHGKMVAEYDDFIPFDKVAHAENGELLLLKNGSIMNQSSQAVDFAKAVAANKLFMSVKNPAYKEIKGDHNSLEKAEDRKEQENTPYNIDKNVSAQFKNFAIKYVGVNHGEGDDYYVSQDGNVFYSLRKEKGGDTMYISKTEGGIEEVLSAQPLSTQMKMRKLFTRDYIETDYQAAKYIGEKGGMQMVQYTVRGLDGTLKIQSGAEVKKVLGEDYAAPEGYEIQGFYVDGKPLADNAKCPKGTVLIIKYKKTATTN